MPTETLMQQRYGTRDLYLLPILTVFELLDGHIFPAQLVTALDDHTICSLSNPPQVIIVVHLPPALKVATTHL